jgi:hypothetical protein
VRSLSVAPSASFRHRPDAVARASHGHWRELSRACDFGAAATRHATERAQGPAPHPPARGPQPSFPGGGAGLRDAQLPEDVDRVRRLGPPGVVGVSIHGPDEAFTVDHEPSRDGQAPGAVVIASGQVSITASSRASMRSPRPDSHLRPSPCLSEASTGHCDHALDGTAERDERATLRQATPGLERRRVARHRRCRRCGSYSSCWRTSRESYDTRGGGWRLQRIRTRAFNRSVNLCLPPRPRSAPVLLPGRFHTDVGPR